MQQCWHVQLELLHTEIIFILMKSILPCLVGGWEAWLFAQLFAETDLMHMSLRVLQLFEQILEQLCLLLTMRWLH